ncbi:proline-rich protein [Mycena galericulata]|nr:proline-rich protein [Mycena galericulata]
MWTLTAPFGQGVAWSKENTPLGPPNTRLIKPGKSYPVGRRDVPLILGSKKVSKLHGEFAVEEFTADDVADPTIRPKVYFTNSNQKDKVVFVVRGDDTITVNPGATSEVISGDRVGIANVDVLVEWKPVCCYQQSQVKSKYPKACAALGIHFIHTPSSDITHHITSTYAATNSHALSLLTATAFVRSEWLDEVIRLGGLPLNSDPSASVSLEEAWILPSVSKYRPNFHADLTPEHKTFKVWDPNEGRLKMFSSYRFLCLRDGKRDIDSELRDLLTRGAGKVDVFNVKEGTDKLRGALVRGKAKINQKVVLLADQEACKVALGNDGWNVVMELAKTFELKFFSSGDVLQAILNADASLLDPSEPVADRAASSSPLPDYVPNTHADESSIVPEPEEPEPEPEKPARRLTRRTTSRQASQEPQPDVEAPVPARRHLTRRAQPTGLPIITGLDDPSVILNNMPDTSMAAPSVPIEPTKPRSKLKRRVGVAAPPDNVESLISAALNAGVEPETGEEPPLKKFKALFDASHPTRSGAESFVQQSGAFDDDELMSIANVGSQTQSQTQTGSKRTTRSGNGLTALGPLQEEEEEESQMPIDGPTAADASKKRKQRSFDGDDIEMAGVEDAVNGVSGSSVPAVKKRAVEENAVERTVPKPPAVATQPSKVLAPTKSTGKKAATGAPTGKPDTDTAFLKAIASTKRGKKTEDDFDRDFNKLKISKSGLRGEEIDHRPEWELLENFGDEDNLRGNFMVIHDLDVFKVDREPVARRRSAGNDPRWEGKPDFKKFKKQSSIAPRKKVIELIISDENDTGLGPGYWKGGSSQNPDDDFGASQKHQTQTAKRSTQATASRSKAKSQAMIIDDSSDEEVAKPKGKRVSKPPSKAEPPKKRTARGASKVPDTPAPLFLDSDSDDIVNVPDEDEPYRGGTMDEDEFDAGQTMASSAETTAPPTRRSTRMPAGTKKKAAPIIVDDGDDDGAVFTGFGKRKTRRS